MEEQVKSEFERFLSEQLPLRTLDIVDDIVLMYITSVLEQLGDDECFDVEEFIDMMKAYIPGFENIPSENVCSWVLNLAGHLIETRSRLGQQEGLENISRQSRSLDSLPSYLSTLTKGRSLSVNSPSGAMTTTAEASNSCEGVTNYQRDEQDARSKTEFDAKVASLSEIFPAACSIEVRRCLLVANNDVEAAARLMFMSRESQESGDAMAEGEAGELVVLVDSRPKPHQRSAKRQEMNERDQDNIKTTLVSRYGFIDVDIDQRIHRPAPPKQGPIEKLFGDMGSLVAKKMTRYRDNQVVSTKGERFTLVKNTETDEEKKTYVNLKPARKYRFH